jgi:hypothetical protein
LKAVPIGFSTFRLTLLFGFVWSASASLVPESEVWEVLFSNYVRRLHVVFDRIRQRGFKMTTLGVWNEFGTETERMDCAALVTIGSLWRRRFEHLRLTCKYLRYFDSWS